jgi:hypothetical protein
MLNTPKQTGSFKEYNLISSNTLEFKVKFKLVELFENAKIMMAKK